MEPACPHCGGDPGVHPLLFDMWHHFDASGWYCESAKRYFTWRGHITAAPQY